MIMQNVICSRQSQFSKTLCNITFFDINEDRLHRNATIIMPLCTMNENIHLSFIKYFNAKKTSNY